MRLWREVLTLAVDTVWPRCLLCGRRRLWGSGRVCSSCGVLVR